MKARGAFAAFAPMGGALVVSLATAARGDVPLPPWVEEGEVPPPAWAQSVARRPDDSGLFGDPDEAAGAPAGSSRTGTEGPTGLVLFTEPNRASGRRGVSSPGATLPFFGTKRGSGCSGAWWLVGALAWTCSDDAVLSTEAPSAPARMLDGAGLATQYMFVKSGGASAYASLESAEDGEADEELEGGWAVATVEQRTASGEANGKRWVRTTKGLWLAQQDVSPARPSLFQGEKVDDGRLDFAWVLSDRASVWATAPASTAAPRKDKPSDARARFQVVRIREESGRAVRIGDAAWMLASDLARPRVAPVPAGVAGKDERWIDVDTASQTLVAYQGTRPVYATLVSTGLSARGAGDATPLGIHRVWVKLLASDMGNVEHEDGEPHYSLEDVPYVQFFDNAVGLHGTYWHGDFGHQRSHGCVNLSPLDAHWMFDFTSPHLPAGWAAAYPTSIEPGTLVRVR
ncbi:MAG TPA: L,D-transpeptidase [Polyangiaceae bacterium]